MAITLTDKAAERVHKLLAKEGSGLGLRVGLKKMGCSGMAYTFNIAHEVTEGDAVFEHNGAKVMADSKALVFLDGSQLDYVREGLQEAFRFTNPNEKASCGCGESVSFELPARTR